MRFAGFSATGPVRDHNEDAWTSVTLGCGQELLIVSDGVGGSSAGDLAADVVIRTLPALLDSRLPRVPTLETSRSTLQDCLVQLSHQLVGQANGIPEFRGMAATVVCTLVTGKSMVVGSMGDSRAYLLHSGALSQLTRDHTIVQALLDLDEITLEQAIDHPAAGWLTQAVGMEQEPLPDVEVHLVAPGDRLLMETDGLHSMVEDGMIARLLSNSADPETACKSLIAAALRAGGRDNVTVVVIDWEQG